MSEPTEDHSALDPEEAVATDEEVAAEDDLDSAVVECDTQEVAEDGVDNQTLESVEDVDATDPSEDELPSEDPIYIAEARLHDMDAVFAIAESAGLSIARESVLHNYSLVAKRGDEVLGAALGSLDSETGESVVTIVSPPVEEPPEEADEAAEGEAADIVDIQPVLDTMAHKACKKLRAKHHKICRIKHPQDDDFWRSIRFIRPAA